MTSELARQKAAQAWCKPETEKIEMIPELAEAFATIIDEYIKALKWYTGSTDFNPGG